MELQELLDRKEAALRDAVANGVQESLTLDFKLASEGEVIFKDDGALTADGRKVIAKILSAFSNSAGGLVVFGVECKPIDKVDCASKLVPLSNFQRAHSSLNSAVGDLLQPKNSGIAVHSFASDIDPSKGYIIVDVPRSDRRPHRSEAAKQKGYFKRSGANSYEMEHYDIEDAFRRQASPDLELEIRLHLAGMSGILHTIEMSFWVRNMGDVAADQTMLEIPDPQGNTYSWPRENGDTRLVTSGRRIKYYTDSEFVLHPGDDRQVARAQFKVIVDGQGEQVLSVEPNREVPFERPLEFELKAKGMRNIRAAFDFEDVELRDQPWLSHRIIRQSRRF
jgi:hypothetical protein